MARLVVAPLFVLTLLVCVLLALWHQRPARFTTPGGGPVSIGIRWLDRPDERVIDDLVSHHRGKRLGYLPQLRTSLLSLEGPVDKITARLSARADVVAVAENVVAQVTSITNDPELAVMDYLDGIAVPDAWDTSAGDGVTIAFVDSGIDTAHPDLNDNIVAGYDFVDNDADPTDTGCGHGTAVTGIAAAEGDNELGVVGVAYQASIMPIRVMDNNCSGSASTIAQGIVYAVDHGADIINVSLNADDPLFIPGAIAYAKEHDVLVVAAAGNAGTYYANGANMPPASDDALVVGGLSALNTLYGNSNHGPHMVVAPSESIRTTRPVAGGAYGSFSLTSAASPIVAGIAALVKSAHPDYSRAEICWAIKLSSTDLDLAGQDATFGWGRVNAAAAIAYSLPDFVPDSCASSALPPSYGWSHVLNTPGAGAMTARSIAARGGHTVVTGGFTGTADFDPSARAETRTSDASGAQLNSFLTVVSNGGRHRFTRVPLGSNADSGVAVAVQANGDLVVATNFTQSVNFAGDQGNDTLTAQEQGIAVSLWHADGSYDKTWRLDSSNSDLASDLAVDAAGNIYLVGIFRSTIDFDPGPATYNLTADDATGDAFLAAYAADGAFRFAQRIGSAAQDIAQGVAVDDTSVYVTGRTGGTTDFDPGPANDTRSGAGGFLSAYSLAGAYRWVRAFAGYAYPKDVAVRPGQNVHVVGHFLQTVDMDDSAATSALASNANSQDAFLAAFAPAGAYLWSTAFGSPGADVAHSVATGADGTIHLGGSFTGTVDFDPGPDTDTRTAAGYQDAYIASYQPGGGYVATWARGSTFIDEVLSVQVDEYGTLHYAGVLGGPVNLATAGTPDFAKSGAFYGQTFAETSQPALTLATSTVSRGNAAVAIQGLASDADSVIAAVEYSLSPGADAWNPCSLGADGPGSFACTLDLATDSPAPTVYLRAEDRTGNRTAPGAFGRVPVVDGPIVVLAGLDAEPTFDTTPTLTGTVTDSDGAITNVQFQVDHTDGTWVDCVADDATFDGGSEGFGCTTPALDIGRHTVFVVATDNDGHVSGPFRSSFTVAAVPDTAPPSVSITQPIPSLTTDNTPTATGEAVDAAGTVASVELQVDGSTEAWVPCAASDGQFDSASEAFTCTTPALADGAHTLRLRASDSAGNHSLVDAAMTANFTIDTTGPSLTLPALTPDPTTSNSPTLTGTAADGLSLVEGVEFALDDRSTGWAACRASSAPFDSAIEAFSCTTAPLPEGPHTIHVRSRDHHGNVSAPQSDSFTVDSTLPTVTLTPLTPDPHADNTPTLSGTARDAGGQVIAVQYRVDTATGAWLACTAVDGAFDGETEPYTCTTNTLSNAKHTIYVRAVDAAGNPSAIIPDKFTIKARR